MGLTLQELLAMKVEMLKKQLSLKLTFYYQMIK